MTLDPVRVALIDLDGTLADCRHRMPLVVGADPPDWEGFFAACDRDEPFAHVAAIVRGLCSIDVPVMFLTGRPERNRDATLRWLVRHRIPHTLLLMRGDDDRRKDSEVKLAMVATLRGWGYEPLFALDDRPSMVRAYRGAGIPTLDVGGEEWAKSRAAGLRNFDGSED